MNWYTRSVLVAESDPVERKRLAAALERDGFEVLLCSGPTTRASGRGVAGPDQPPPT
jgi:CheY-like chemotaxis protein